MLDSKPKQIVPHFTTNSHKKPFEEIYESIKCIHLACRIFGLEPITFSKKEGFLSVEHTKHDLIYYTLFCCLYMLLGGYTILTLFFEMTSLFANAKSKFTILITAIILLVFCILSANYVMRKQISSSLVSFGKIDTVLLRYNAQINYNDMKKDNVGLMILMFSSVVVRSLIMIVLIDLDFLQSFAVFAVLSAKALTKYQFISYVNQLEKRFEKVNDTLKEIYEKTTKDKIIFSHLSNEDVISEGILIMCRQHHQLCQWMRILNKAFGLQQLSSIAVSVCNILFQTYYLYFVLAENNMAFLSVLTPLIWTLDELMEIQLLVTSCVEACDNANSTAAILHEMRNGNFNLSLEENIQTYSLQMLHQKIEFSAMGYFVIDYTLTYSIVGAVTTYLVIFIQFDQGSRKKGLVETTESISSLMFNVTTPSLLATILE